VIQSVSVLRRSHDESHRLDDFTSLDDLRLQEEDDPRLQRGEVLVRVHAVSLNFRDIAMLRGRYSLPHRKGLVPTSDGAGEVVEVGAGVDGFKAGDNPAARDENIDYYNSKLEELAASSRHSLLTIDQSKESLGLGKFLNLVKQSVCEASWAALSVGSMPSDASRSATRCTGSVAALSYMECRHGETFAAIYGSKHGPTHRVRMEARSHRWNER